MTTAKKTFERKGVFHSDLVRESDPNGLAVVLKSKPRASKFKGKDPYIYFAVVGEDDEYTLDIENEAIQGYLEDCTLDTPVTIHAHGSRDDASISVENVNGPMVVGGEPAQEGIPQEVAGPPKNEWPNEQTTAQEPPKGASQSSAIEDTYLRCLIAARGAQARFLKETGWPATDEDIRIATTLLIQTNGRG